MIWGLATFAASFVKGLCGFANTLVFTTIMSFFVDNVRITPVDLALGYPSNCILLWKERKAIRWRLCLPMCALVLIGCIPGTLLLKHLDAGFIKALFGVVVILIAILMKAGRMDRRIMLPLGLCSGLLSGLYGVGALVGAYMSAVTDDTHTFKANMCMVFFVEGTFRLALYIAEGIFSPQSLKTAAILFPIMIVGMMLGLYCAKRMNDRKVKNIVIMLLILSGAMLIVNSLKPMFMR